MTDHVDATKVATTPTSRSSEQYVPVVGDRPEGTDVWLRVPYDPDDYGPCPTSPPTSITPTPRTTRSRQRCGRSCARAAAPSLTPIATAACGCR